jgi:N-acetylmuramoyl-L-alanine amidase
MANALAAASAEPRAARYTIIDHFLHLDGKPIAQKRSPNHGGVIRPRLLVMHYTGGLSTLGAINTLTHPAAKVSAHLVLSPDGVFTQLLPFNVTGWHAGASKWKGKAGCNSFSIGIEMVNAGLLGRDGKNGYYARLEHKPIGASRVCMAAHKNAGGVEPWQVYPAAQIDAAIGAASAIVEAYGIKDIAGHDDIAPGRKIDPGPAWPMEAFIARVFGRA